MIFDSRERADYIQSAVEMAHYIKLRQIAPFDVQSRYYGRLKTYRLYLDKEGGKIPDQIYPYDPERPSTWRYSLPDGRINNRWKYR